MTVGLVAARRPGFDDGGGTCVYNLACGRVPLRACLRSAATLDGLWVNIAKQPVLRFIQRLLREQPVRFVSNVTMMTVVGMLEGVGVAALVPILSIIGGSAPSGRAASLIAWAIGLVGLKLDLATGLGFVLVILLAQQLATIAQNRIAHGSVYKFEFLLRERLFSGVMRAGWPFFLSHKTSDVSNALTQEADRTTAAYNYLNTFLSSALVVVIYIALAFALSWQMTLVVLVVGVLLNAFLRERVTRGTKHGAAITDYNANLQGEVLESVGGAKLVKGCGAEETQIERFVRVASMLASEQFKMNMNVAWIRVLYDSASMALLIIAMYVSVTVFHLNVASLVVFMLIFYRVSPRISNIQVNLNFVLSYLPALDAMDELTAEAERAAEPSGTQAVGRLADAVRFADVVFGYDPEEPVLRGAEFTICAGKTTAIVGSSGAGKTTAVDLVMGLVRPQSGQVSVDGVSVADIELAAWRRRIGYVAQESVLFHSSVRDNIAWGTVGLSSADIENAAHLAFADEFILELPDGYDTIVGDRGVRLSGGQRQRIALARALARKPELLILDEATSALDVESERRIQMAIDKIAGSITVLVVTHRLSTIRNADVINVLEGGRIVESGTWDELIASDGRFHALTLVQGGDGQN
jgi:ATP-binding cassette subfamily C protein